MERRLAAVLVADVVGYVRLSQADEEGTRARFQADLREVFQPAIATHHGRLVKTMGDALLVEFHSVVDALRCAIAIQRAKTARSATTAEDQRLVYRIGINLGDVIVEGDDIHGDGVNIAERLQGLAEPGGVMISGTTYDHLKSKVEVGYAFSGEQRVKNVTDPIRVYRVLMDPRDVGKRIGERVIAAHLQHRMAAVAVAILLLAGAGGLSWWLLGKPVIPPPAATSVELPLPDKPSIAVLPFVNMSDDPKQESFADGVTDDLITELSKVSGLFVISRNSTFVYKGKTVSPKQVSKELGVRYVLEGSVQRSGDQLRINAQLIDALSGGHNWADKFDGSLANVFALQDKVTRGIADALAIKLTATEEESLSRLETNVPAAYDAFLRGWVLFRRRNPDDLAKAIPHFEEAIKLDPEYGRPYAALTMVYFKAYEWGWNQSLGLSWREEADRKARQYLVEARKRPTALSHQAAGWMLWVDGQFDQAVAEFKEAIELDPGDSFSYAYMGGALYSLHRATEAVAQIRFAMRLDPHYPSEYVHFLGLAQFALEQYDAAAASFGAAIKLNPEDEWPFAALAATYGHLGRKDEAAETLARFNQLRINRADTPLTIDEMPWLGFTDSDFRRLADGFRLAGVPEDLFSGEFAGLPRLTADEVRALFLGHRLHGRNLAGEERAASIAPNGVPTWTGDWGSVTGSKIRFEGTRTCFGVSCGAVLRNASGTKAIENEYVWIDRRGAFTFSQVE